MYRKLIYNFGIGMEALGQNRLRAFLTSLGIIFGVASVIAMLAIGRGAQAEIIEQMELLGANNIIINPVLEQEEGDLAEEEESTDAEAGEESGLANRFTPGLSMQDVTSLNRLPQVDYVRPEIVIESIAIRKGRKRSNKLVGVTNEFFEELDQPLIEGRLFNEAQHNYGYPVCIIGSAIKSRFFPKDEPIGKQIKCGHLWLTVVGVMAPRHVSREVREELANLGIRNYDFDIYTPVKTLLLRYENRALITAKDVQDANRRRRRSREIENYHQLDKVVMRVSDVSYIRKIAEVSNRMLSRRHNEVVDYEITVPEQLLAQRQRTMEIFNIVLGAIASISLLVGGIGIMNIMLASVMERIKEIGLRMSIGATRKDIILQFMSEAVAISVSGGLIGILLGLGLSYVIRVFADIQTIVSTWSVVLAFFVAVLIGLIFGIYPARRASAQDPVVSLRSN
ncbi:MAG: ABC transporter permease [Bacteroidota bacterium]